MKRLSRAQVAKLETAYRAGEKRSAAARAAGCSFQSATNWFATFEHRGLPRWPSGPIKPRKTSTRKLPRYDGPAIIGVAIPSALPTTGWIGKP